MLTTLARTRTIFLRLGFPSSNCRTSAMCHNDDDDVDDDDDDDDDIHIYNDGASVCMFVCHVPLPWSAPAWHLPLGIAKN